MEGHRRKVVNLQMALCNRPVRRILLDWLVNTGREGWRTEFQRQLGRRYGLGQCVQAS